MANFHRLLTKYNRSNTGRIFLYAVILLFLSCQPNNQDQPNTPSKKASLATMVIEAYDLKSNSNIVLVELATRTDGTRKEVMLKGRVIQFNGNLTSSINRILDATFFDIERKDKSITSASTVSKLFEERLKKVPGFTKGIDLPQNLILQILKGEKVKIAALGHSPSDYGIGDFLIGLVSQKAYAQNDNTDINTIIGKLVKGVVGVLDDCSPYPSDVKDWVIDSASEILGVGFIVSTAQCGKAIYDLAQTTAGLWDFVAGNVSKALDPNSPYSATNFITDLKIGNQSTTAGNTQTVSPSPAGGSFGDPHLTTMDGLYYDFQGYGEFIALKSTTDAFEIQVRQEEISPYRNGKITMNTALAINTVSDVICLFPSEMYINKQRYTFTLSGQREFALKQGTATLSNNFLTIQTPNSDIIRVNIQNLGQGFLDYRVTLNDNRRGKVKGLLGNFDDNRANDVQAQNGTAINPFVFTEIYPTYTNSWRISDNNSLFEYPTGKKTADFTRSDYPKITADIDPTLRAWAEGICRNNGITDEPYFSACVMDVALANSDRYAVSALAAEENKLRLKSFDINQFTSFEALNLNDHGNPKIEGGLLYLTKPRGAAAVYQKYKVEITNGFEVNIDFSFTEAGGILDAKREVGADGIAFIIQDYNSKIVPPSAGQGLGYNGLPRSLAIEFDTFTNGGQDSPDADIWLNTQGTRPNSVADATTLIKPQTRPIANLVDGKIHKALIRYVKKTDTTYKLEVFVDGEANPYLTADNINIQNMIGAYSSGVYLGLTAATDAGYQNHIIHRWAYKPL